MKKLFAVALLGSALALSACGDEDDPAAACSADNLTGTCPAGEVCDAGVCVVEDTAIPITISGTIQPHPVSDGINATLFTLTSGVVPRLTWGAAGDVVIQIVDPVDVIANPTGFTPLAAAPIDLTTCIQLTTTDDGLDCTFSFADVDISGLTLGLIALIADTRGTPEYIVTNAGVFGAGTVAELQASGADYTTARIFGISDESLGALVGVLNAGTPPSMAKDKATVIADGFIFGNMLSNAFVPQAGVTVAPTDATIEIFYFEDDFQSEIAMTSATGFFLGVATPAPTVNTVNTSWTVTDAGMGGSTWTDIPAAGTSRGTGFTLSWIAD